MLSLSHWGMFAVDRPPAVNISIPITIHAAASRDEVGRTMYQSMRDLSTKLGPHLK